MKQCRMNKAIKLCKCNPPFYKPIKWIDPRVREYWSSSSHGPSSATSVRFSSAGWICWCPSGALPVSSLAFRCYLALRSFTTSRCAPAAWSTRIA
ncbi:GL20563 [Drosophila persimilis]|uniref:GL20563 n=1 Tax=Drosophila persimilis TaxID=7234 RepID=B4GWK9_DROPE|nr:GL20563 [Drosophila persimilis]